MTANIRFSGIFRLACLSMFGMVGVGAMYGHKGRIQQERVYMFNRAQVYHLMNNIGLICASLIPSATLPWKIAVGGFCLGLLAFVIPMYITAVNGRIQGLSKSMPVGGMGMLTGWISLIFA